VTLGKAFEEALATRPNGSVEAQGPRARAEVEVVESDRLGVTVRRVTIRREEPRDIAEEARELPERLRSLPERFDAIEVDPGLGGAILRTCPEDIGDDREYYELDVHGRDVELSRKKVEVGGTRADVDFTLTRKQLGRLLDELE
jgi:hypothetical protein